MSQKSRKAYIVASHNLSLSVELCHAAARLVTDRQTNTHTHTHGNYRNSCCAWNFTSQKMEALWSSQRSSIFLPHCMSKCLYYCTVTWFYQCWSLCRPWVPDCVARHKHVAADNNISFKVLPLSTEGWVATLVCVTDDAWGTHLPELQNSLP